MASIRVSDYLVKRCAQSGLNHVFMVTGGGAMFLNDSFGRSVEFKKVFFHHEQSAAMAAEGYFRRNSSPVVVNVTTGPGGINALNGVYGAFVDSVPMLVISGQVKRSTIARNHSIHLRQLGDQEVDIIEMAKPIVKFGALVQEPKNIGCALDIALHFMCSGRFGPVWLDVPVDVQGALVNENHLVRWCGTMMDFPEEWYVHPNTMLELNNRKQIEDYANDIDELIDRLNRAKSPVFMIGNGVRLAGITTQVLDMAERLQIPLVAGWNAYDLVPNTHPSFAGRPGTVGDRAGNFSVQNADFLLVLGCRLNIRQISYNWESFASKAWKAMVDIDQAELDKPTLNFQKKICTDLRDFWDLFSSKQMMLSGMKRHEEFLLWCKSRVETYSVVNKESTLPGNECFDEFIDPYVFVSELFDSLGTSACVVTGNGSACVIGFQAAKLTGQRIFTNSGAASMGYDLPAVIGASLATPLHPTICLTGDGSVMMNLQELAVIAGLKLPIKIICLMNDGYLSIRLTQKSFFDGRLHGSNAESGLHFPSFKKVFDGFGINAHEVLSIRQFRDFISAGFFESLEPSAMLVRVDPNKEFQPKLSSKRLPDGSMQSPTLEDMAPFLSDEEMAQNLYSP